MCNARASSVAIIPENTGEARVYVAQFFSARRGKVIREYADAINPADVAAMGSADRARVQHFGLVNLGKATASQGTCSTEDCHSCGKGCGDKSLPIIDL